MAAIYLIEGPVGAGKSTFARRLAEDLPAMCFVLDKWFPLLYSDDRPATGVTEWYVQRKQRCVDLIWSLANEHADRGFHVVVELGLVQRAMRRAIYDQAANVGCDLRVYVLDAPREVRRERVKRRNAARGPTWSMNVDDHVFDIASDLWEPFDDIETEEVSAHIITTG